MSIVKLIMRDAVKMADCPTCEQPAGDACLDDKGRTHDYPHTARLDAFRKIVDYPKLWRRS